MRGAELRCKRAACRPIEDEVRRRVAARGADKFAALLMPSPNMHDVDLLLAAGLSQQDIERNVRIIERDPEAFRLIWEALRKRGVLRPERVMTSRPMGLVRRVSVVRGPLDWANLDMCGPIHPALFRGVAHLAGELARGSCFQITVRCGREHAKDKALSLQLAAWGRDIGLPTGSAERRRLALFALVAAAPLFPAARRAPGKPVLVPDKYFHVAYRADGSNAVMLCDAAVYRHGSEQELKGILPRLWEASHES